MRIQLRKIRDETMKKKYKDDDQLSREFRSYFDIKIAR